MSLLGAAAISGAASLVSGGIGALSTGKMNRRAERFARDMWEKQGQREQDFWRMQNQYNLPSEQMQRLKDAGLNPHLVYGSGADAQAGPLKAGGAPSTPNFKPITPDLGGVVQNALHAEATKAGIERTKAETAAINSRTVDQDFKNSLNQTIGISNMAERYNRATDTIAIRSEKDNAEWEMMKAVGYDSKTYSNKNKPAARAMKAGFKRAEVELENATRLGDLRRAQRAIMQYKENLVKQGINPDSPWYIKAIGDVINQAAPQLAPTPLQGDVKSMPFNFNKVNR